MKKLDLYNKQTLFYKEFNKKVVVQLKKKLIQIFPLLAC